MWLSSPPDLERNWRPWVFSKIFANIFVFVLNTLEIAVFVFVFIYVFLVCTCILLRKEVFVFTFENNSSPCIWINYGVFEPNPEHQCLKDYCTNTDFISSIGSTVAPLTGWYWVWIPVGLALRPHITSSSCHRSPVSLWPEYGTLPIKGGLHASSNNQLSYPILSYPILSYPILLFESCQAMIGCKNGPL